MPAYVYLVEDSATGRRQMKTALAESLPALVEAAVERGEKILQFTELTRRPWSRVPLRLEDRATFYRHLSSLLEAGTPLVEALQLMGREATHEGLRLALRDISQRMRMGETFTEAAVRYPDIFDENLVQMLRAAEQGGSLDAALDETADHLEEMNDLGRRVAPLFIYPVMVMTVLSGASVFFMTFVLPRFSRLYMDLGMQVQDFPTVSRLLMQGMPIWTAIAGSLALLVIGGLALRAFWPTTYFRVLHAVLPRLPLGPWQEILYHLEMTRFVTTLSLLLRRGVSLVPALQMASRTLSHSLYQKAALRCAGLVSLGHPFSEAVREVEVFPESLTVQLALAEREGDLASPLRRLAELYRHQAEYLARRGINLLEPALVVAIGLFVLFILLGVFSPLVRVVSQLSGGG